MMDAQAPHGPLHAAKRLLRRSVAVNEAYFIVKNTVAGIRGGIEHADFGRESDVAARADYAEEVFSRYLGDADLTRAELEGLRVVEIGPGDNQGAAFLFALNGADVWTPDAFLVSREPGADEATADELARRCAAGDPPRSARDVLSGIHASLESRRSGPLRPCRPGPSTSCCRMLSWSTCATSRRRSHNSTRCSHPAGCRSTPWT